MFSDAWEQSGNDYFGTDEYNDANVEGNGCSPNPMFYHIVLPSCVVVKTSAKASLISFSLTDVFYNSSVNRKVEMWVPTTWLKTNNRKLFVWKKGFLSNLEKEISKSNTIRG